MTTTAVFPFDVAARDCMRSYHLSGCRDCADGTRPPSVGNSKRNWGRRAGVAATKLAIVPLRCRARDSATGLVARGGGGVFAFGSSGAVCPVALGIGAFRATPADTWASMILSLGSTRKHVAAARSDGNLAAPVTCAIVRPTKPGVPDLPLSLNRSMLPARKQNGAVAPWNHYSRVPLFPRSLAGGGNERHHLSHRPDRSHLGDPFVFRPALRGRRWSISPPFDATPWPLPST